MMHKLDFSMTRYPTKTTTPTDLLPGGGGQKPFSPKKGKEEGGLDATESQHLGESFLSGADSQPGLCLHNHRHVAENLLCHAGLGPHSPQGSI